MRIRPVAAMLLLGAMFARGDDFEIVNVENMPGDLQSTGYGWSAVRMEDQRFQSYRCAADDFVLEAASEIEEIGFWVVKLGNPEIIGPDWYVYADDADGAPGTLITGQGAAAYVIEDIGLINDYFGTLYFIRIQVSDLRLDAGRYFLGFRVYQEYVAGGKNNYGSLTTNFGDGETEGWWNFAVDGDGNVGDAWVQMREFNRKPNNEWAFSIRGRIEFSGIGDCNCDGEVDFGDIDAFVIALTDPGIYEETYPGCNWRSADVNCDGRITFDDVEPFTDCVLNGSCECD
jgi:hypothetical protein